MTLTEQEEQELAKALEFYDNPPVGVIRINDESKKHAVTINRAARLMHTIAPLVRELVEARKKATPGEWSGAHREKSDDKYSTEIFTDDGKTIATMHWYPKPKVNGVVGTYRESNTDFIATAANVTSRIAEKVGRG